MMQEYASLDKQLGDLFLEMQKKGYSFDEIRKDVEAYLQSRLTVADVHYEFVSRLSKVQQDRKRVGQAAEQALKQAVQFYKGQQWRDQVNAQVDLCMSGSMDGCVAANRMWLQHDFVQQAWASYQKQMELRQGSCSRPSAEMVAPSPPRIAFVYGSSPDGSTTIIPFKVQGESMTKGTEIVYSGAYKMAIGLGLSGSMAELVDAVLGVGESLAAVKTGDKGW